jgi:Na+(H+)/acetate symporter ActP
MSYIQSLITLADMIAARFDAKKVRGVAALNTMTISIFYMIAQLVGAGALIKLLLGIEYTTSVLIVGTLMTVYVVLRAATPRTFFASKRAAIISAKVYFPKFLSGSATSIAGAIALTGFDGFFYSIGFLVAYLVVLYLVAEPLCNHIKDRNRHRIKSCNSANFFRIKACCNHIRQMRKKFAELQLLIR